MHSIHRPGFSAKNGYIYIYTDTTFWGSSTSDVNDEINLPFKGFEHGFEHDIPT